MFVTTVRVLSLNLFSKSRFSSLHLSAFACNLNMHRGHTSCVWNCSLRDFSKSYFGFSSFYLTLVTRAFGLIEWMYVNYVTSISCQITLTCDSPAMPSRRLVAEMPGIRRGWWIACGRVGAARQHTLQHAVPPELSLCCRQQLRPNLVFLRSQTEMFLKWPKKKWFRSECLKIWANEHWYGEFWYNFETNDQSVAAKKNRTQPNPVGVVTDVGNRG